jgi:hypothetical protein
MVAEFFMQRFCWALAAVTVGLWASPELCRAQAAAPPSTAWLTGPELQRQLSQSCGVTWAGVPFRAAVRQLADTHRVAVLIDRRIDPDRSIDLASGDVSLSELIAQIAAQRNAEQSLVGAVVYLAPPEAARPIRTLVAQRTDSSRGTPRDLQSRLLARKPMSWADRATPRDLVIGLADEAGLLLSGDQVERLPHDLWAPPI